LRVWQSGAFRGGNNEKKRRDPAACLAAFLVCIGIWGFASPFLLHALDPQYILQKAELVHVLVQWITLRYVISFAVVFPPSLCMGALSTRHRGVVQVNRYRRPHHRLPVGAQPLGGIAGSLSAAFLLVPVLGIQRSLVVLQ